MSLLTNLISYWKLDGNSNDSVGSSNGTDTSIVYSTGNGKVLQGAGFDGATSRITGAIVQPVSAYTVAMWVRNDGLDNIDINYRMFDTQDPVMTSTGMVFTYNPNVSGGGTSRLRTYHNNGSFTQSPDLGGLLNDGLFHLVGVAWDGSIISFYVDGTLVGSNSFSDSITNYGDYDIGHSRGTGSIWLGAIDEVGVWSRALSDTEISELYNSGEGLQYPFNQYSGDFLLNFI